MKRNKRLTAELQQASENINGNPIIRYCCSCPGVDYHKPHVEQSNYKDNVDDSSFCLYLRERSNTASLSKILFEVMRIKLSWAVKSYFPGALLKRGRCARFQQAEGKLDAAQNKPLSLENSRELTVDGL